MNKEKVIRRATRNIGVIHGDKYHQQIVDGYNRVKPLPVGYTVLMSDDWCDVFITWLFDKEGMADLIGRECGVQRHLNIFRNKGIWKGRVRPASGDIVVFDWEGHQAGWADHIGIVERVSGNTIHTIEGNTGNPRRVMRKSYAYNQNSIVGYARPEYQSKSKMTTVTVDGYLGRETIRALQSYFGTFMDGIISGQYSGNQATQAFTKGSVEFENAPRKGSPVVRALQKHIKMKNVDGLWGRETTLALQGYLNTYRDGVVDRPSNMVRELQRRLNKGNL